MLVKKINGQVLTVLDLDQPITATLTQIVIDKGIKGGHITGIGAVKDVQLGYYELHKNIFR